MSSEFDWKTGAAATALFIIGAAIGLGLENFAVSLYRELFVPACFP